MTQSSTDGKWRDAIFGGGDPVGPVCLHHSGLVSEIRATNAKVDGVASSVDGVTSQLASLENKVDARFDNLEAIVNQGKGAHKALKILLPIIGALLAGGGITAILGAT